MMAAMRAYLFVFFQLLVEDHLFALRTFRPQALRDFALASGAGAHGLLFNRRLLLRGWGSHCRFNCFKSECFFGLFSHNAAMPSPWEYVVQTHLRLKPKLNRYAACEGKDIHSLHSRTPERRRAGARRGTRGHHVI